jgi:hypothetical protein
MKTHEVELDGTLAVYTKYRGVTHIGEPLVSALKQVIEWLDAGDEVKIKTTRICGDRSERDKIAAQLAIENWCEKHIGRVLPVECIQQD